MIKNIIHSLILLTVFVGLQPALAVVPPTLNYQGHLTDSAGVPIDGSVNMTFSIYDVASGGTALWSDTQSVSVDQGAFSVELGGGGNPFPPGLFEAPLWMGLTVGTDTEMTPRRPFSSTAFTFKAADADTLEGVSAATLDQSAHVIDTANPHNVTAAQIGASTGPHTVDTNAATLCKTRQFLNGDGNCYTGFLDADGVDAYNAAYDTEAEIDAAVANNGYSTGAHTTDTNAGTICPNNTFLNGDGTCDVIPAQYPEVNNSGRKNTSSSPIFFNETNHHLTATYLGGGNNEFSIVSDNGSIGTYVIIDDGTGSTTSGVALAVGASITKTISISRVAAIDVIEALDGDKIYRYRCMSNGSANLVICTQEIY